MTPRPLSRHTARAAVVGLAFGCVVASSAASAKAPRGASPVVLLPGFMGWRDIETVGPYFAGLREALEAAGADVFALAPPPIADSEARGAYVMRAIDDVLLRTGAEKVAVIAHSQGGVDVRVALAHGYASKIAVIATLSSPHEGTELADAALAWFPRSVVRATLTEIAWTWDGEQHIKHRTPDPDGALASLSRAGMKEFNARHPTTAGVPFFSLAAVTGDDVDGGCARGGRWGAPDRVDALHPLFLAAHALIRLRAGDVSDDGVVPTARQRFGTFLGCVPGDHVDWMGWKLGRDDGAYAQLDDKAFLVELWRGMRDVELTGDERAMDAHVEALAALAHAHVLEPAPGREPAPHAHARDRTERAATTEPTAPPLGT